EQQHGTQSEPGEGDPRNQAVGPTLTRLGDAPQWVGKRRDTSNRDDDVTQPAPLRQLPEVANQRDIAHAINNDNCDGTDRAGKSVVTRRTRAQPGATSQTEGYGKDRLTNDRYVRREPLRVHVPERDGKHTVATHGKHDAHRGVVDRHETA